MTKPRFETLPEALGGPLAAGLSRGLAPELPESLSPSPRPFDVQAIRADFPILRQKVHGKELVYLDNAATTQKPRQVIEAMDRYYRDQNANIHRGVYTLSEQATALFEEARRKVQRFLNAARPQEIIFTRGATDSINLVAGTFGRKTIREGDEIVLSAMEHHSNIVPWQLLCEQTGARLRVIPINDAGELLLDEYEKLLNARTKLVTVLHTSNALGTINPVKQIIKIAHAQGVPVLIDGAQWVAHGRTDVRDLDCDFYAFSGHKVFGPTGIGVLYGKHAFLESMPPYQGGGDMIAAVSFERTMYADPPHRFEAGTPHIAGAIGLGEALDYVVAVGPEKIALHETHLLSYATERIQAVPGLRVIGTARHKGAVISFVFENPPIAAQDVGLKLDIEGIAVRTGHHCCQPLMDRFNIKGTARASFAVYNTRNEVDRLVEALQQVAGGPTCRELICPEVKADFPEAAGPSPLAVAGELADAFEFLGDWPARYQYIIELGESLPYMPPAMKTEANLVHGCQSTVHISAHVRPGTADVLDFLADSDANIVRGLIAILQKLFSGQQAREILAFDIESFFKRLGLDQHLSVTRRNGLHGMVKRIRALAADISRGMQCCDGRCPLRGH